MIHVEIHRFAHCVLILCLITPFVSIISFHSSIPRHALEIPPNSRCIYPTFPRVLEIKTSQSIPRPAFELLGTNSNAPPSWIRHVSGRGNRAPSRRNAHSKADFGSAARRLPRCPMLGDNFQSECRDCFRSLLAADSWSPDFMRISSNHCAVYIVVELAILEIRDQQKMYRSATHSREKLSQLSADVASKCRQKPLQTQ